MALVVTTVRAEADRVLLIVDGKLVFRVPAGMAREVARSLLAGAARAEEWENPDRLVADGGLLLRAGVGLRLAADQRIHDEAVKASQNDPILRRHLRGSRAPGIKGREKMGLPTVVHGRPPERSRP